MKDLKCKWMNFVDRMNRYGVPVPTVRDPKTGRGSVTAALVVFSAGLFGFIILFMIATVIAKWSGIFLLNDATLSQLKTAADYSFQFLLASLGGYLGRYWQKGDFSTADSQPQTSQKKPESSQKPDDPDQQ